MSRSLNQAEIEKRLAEINARPPEVLPREELEYLAALAADPGETISLEDFKKELGL